MLSSRSKSYVTVLYCSVLSYTVYMLDFLVRCHAKLHFLWIYDLTLNVIMFDPILVQTSLFYDVMPT